MAAVLARRRLLIEGVSGSAGRWRKDRRRNGVAVVACSLLELLVRVSCLKRATKRVTGGKR
jgi:hypothetical protein